MREEIYEFVEEDTLKGKFLTFYLGDECYGIDIMYVKEIINIQTITAVPELPDFIKGIINLRGGIIPVMDARIKLGKVCSEYNDRTCVIVIELIDLSIGIVVDEVAEVLNISEENIVEPPRLSYGGRKYIKSIGKNKEQIILILDCEKLLDEAELNELSDSQN